MLSQGAQGAAGRAERSAARVGERSASDRVVLEGAGLAARTEVCVGRRFHGRHAGVIGVQVGVIHLIHGDEPVRTPVCHRTAERGTHSGQRGVLLCLRPPLTSRDRMEMVQTCRRWSVPSSSSSSSEDRSEAPVSFEAVASDFNNRLK